MIAKRQIVVPLPLSMVDEYETHTNTFKLGGSSSGYFTSPVYNLAEFWSPGLSTPFIVGKDEVHPVQMFVNSVLEKFEGENVVFEKFKTPSSVDYSNLINEIVWPA